MKKNRNTLEKVGRWAWIGLVSLLAVALVGLVVGCDDPTSSEGGPASIDGVWINTQGDPESSADAVLMEFKNSNFWRIDYLERTEETPKDMRQNEGAKGTYAPSGDQYQMVVTHDWNEEQSAWVTLDPTIKVLIDVVNGVLSNPSSPLTMTRATFGQPASLAGTTWSEGETGVLNLIADGTYTYIDTDYNGSGTWSATETLIRTITTKENGSATYVENLYEWVIESGELKLSWGETLMFTYTTSP